MEEKRICPLISGETVRECRESGCMAWREIDHNDWDCALIRQGKR